MELECSASIELIFPGWLQEGFPEQTWENQERENWVWMSTFCGSPSQDSQVLVSQPTQHCRAQGYQHRNSSWPPSLWEHRSDLRSRVTIQKTRNTNSVATQKHFSLRLWNSIEKEQGSRGRNTIQFSRATFNSLCHETVVILLQLSASFTMHLLILTNEQSGSPINKSLLYSTLLIHPLNMLHLCALNEAGMLCKEYIWSFN